MTGEILSILILTIIRFYLLYLLLRGEVRRVR